MIQPTPGDTVLNSPMFPMKWPPLEVVVAVCANRRRERWRPWRTHPIEHDCPNPGLNCGIHAATSPIGLASFLRPSLAADRGDVRVVGQVELWGMIVEGPSRLARRGCLSRRVVASTTKCLLRPGAMVRDLLWASGLRRARARRGRTNYGLSNIGAFGQPRSYTGGVVGRSAAISFSTWVTGSRLGRGCGG